MRFKLRSAKFVPVSLYRAASAAHLLLLFVERVQDLELEDEMGVLAKPPNWDQFGSLNSIRTLFLNWPIGVGVTTGWLKD